MKKPPGLLKKNKVQIVAISSPFDQKRFKLAQQFLLDAGLKLVYSRALFAKKHYLAGTDKQRLQSLLQALNNKNTQAIWFARGGYGSMRLLPFAVDVQWSNKMIIGLSDVTPFLNWYAVQKKCQTIHGPVLCGEQFSNLNLKQKNHILSLLCYPGKKQTLSLSVDYEIVGAKNTKARILGGNLSMLASTLGTAYAVIPKNCFVFLEEVREPAYRLDRMLTQLFQANFFKQSKGIFLGDFTDLNNDFHANAWLLALVHDLIKKYAVNVPIVYGLRSGHVHADVLWPIGGWVEITNKGKQISIDALVE